MKTIYTTRCVACVTGVKRGKGRGGGNLGAQERVGPFRTPATQATRCATSLQGHNRLKKIGEKQHSSAKQETEVILSKNKFSIFFLLLLPITTTSELAKIIILLLCCKNIQWYLRVIPFLFSRDCCPWRVGRKLA